MLGSTAAEVMNKITPADISDPQEVIARAKALSAELGMLIAPGFEALVFKASRGIGRPAKPIASQDVSATIVAQSARA